MYKFPVSRDYFFIVVCRFLFKAFLRYTFDFAINGVYF